MKPYIIFILLSILYMGTWNIFIVQELGIGQENWKPWVWIFPGILTMSLLRYMMPRWFDYIRGVDILWYTILSFLSLGLIWLLG